MSWDGPGRFDGRAWRGIAPDASKIASRFLRQIGIRSIVDADGLQKGCFRLHFVAQAPETKPQTIEGPAPQSMVLKGSLKAENCLMQSSTLIVVLPVLKLLRHVWHLKLLYDTHLTPP
jgi:hypothetical protein